MGIKNKITLRNTLLVSLGLHIAFALIVMVLRMDVKPPAAPAVTVEILENALKTPSKKAIQPDRKIKNQIVQQEEKPPTEEPVDSRFLGPQNQKVQKQTLARERGEFANSKKNSQEKAERSKGSDKPKLSLKDLSPQFDPLAIKEKQQQKKGGDVLEEKGADISKSNDYIRDVEEGTETVLNTREFKFYTYYNRIRRQLSEYWEPKVRDKLHKMFRQGRKIASNQDHITKLLIILDNKGILLKVQILSESGVQDLDDAAIEAFRSAAPFPNPPKGIVERDGTVKIPWDFVLES